MSEHHWMKYGALALGGFGLVLLFVLILNYGQGLEDRTWVVQEMNVEDTMTAPAAGAPAYAVFEDGTIAGSTGCNNYTGAYETDGGSMTIGPLAATRMACAEPLMEQEFAYFILMEQVDSYKVSGNDLTLSNGGTVLIKYTEGTVESNSG